MAFIHSAQSITAPYRPAEPDATPDNLLSGLVLAPTHSPAQATALESALRAAWNAGSAAVPSAASPSLDLSNTGLLRIDSAARVMPRSLHSLLLHDNLLLEALPNDLPDGLRSLSVGNARNLKALPDSLPRALTVEVGGSGLSLNYLRGWAARHPNAGVSFTFGGLAMSLGPSTGPAGGLPTRRPSWAGLAGEGDVAGAAVGQPSAQQSSGATPFTMDHLRRALAGAPERSLQDDQYGLAPGPAGHAASLAECEDGLAREMAVWLRGEEDHMTEARFIAGRCVSHLYALEPEDEHGNKLRSAQEIVDDHLERLNRLGEILDRITDTASYSTGSHDAKLRQQRKVADFLHLLASDKEQCGTGLAAIRIAAETCADALATEGLDMVDAMCTAARSKSEAWAPQDFYRKMEQQIKRDKVRAQVGDIVHRMKVEYGDALIKAIQSDHTAARTSLGLRSGSKLSKLLGDPDHVVQRDGSIAVADPGPNVRASYAVEDRQAYVAQQAARRVDDVEVLSLCQNDMRSRGLLTDVQAGVHTVMHSNSKYSKALNVTPAELEDMARNLGLSRAEVLARMTAWDPWTDYMDREGHTGAVRNDPQLQHDQAERVARMNSLRDTLADFTDQYASDHPDAAQDFALLNNLINAVGTRAVSRHELLRIGGESADAITFGDKERYLAQGTARLAELQLQPQDAAAPAGRVQPSARRTLSARIGLRARPHRSEADADGHRAERSSRRPALPDTVREGDPLSAVAPSFEAGRLALLKSVLDELTGQGPSPYQAALLRKTEALLARAPS